VNTSKKCLQKSTKQISLLQIFNSKIFTSTKTKYNYKIIITYPIFFLLNLQYLSNLTKLKTSTPIEKSEMSESKKVIKDCG